MGMRISSIMVVSYAICVEAPEEEAQRARHLLTAIMEDAFRMPILPLEVEMD